MHRVAILVHDNTALFELGCAVELFALQRPELQEWYQCDVVSFSAGPVAATGGVQLAIRQTDSLAGYSTIVVPSWDTSGRTVPDNLRREFTQAFDAGARVISFCSGAFLLAELGFVNGREATTHWRYAEKLKARFPQVRYVDDVLYVYDGKIGCSAGSAAAIDLGLEIIRGDYGYRVANHVARRLVISAHRKGGQSQFVETPLMEKPGRFAESLDWAMRNLASPIDIGSFARRAHMSRRTFDRRFKSTFNLSPKEWLTTQRLSVARQLIETTRHDIGKVAELSGFANATTLRHHFRKVIGVSPRQYREQFGRPESR